MDREDTLEALDDMLYATAVGFLEASESVRRRMGRLPTEVTAAIGHIRTLVERVERRSPT